MSVLEALENYHDRCHPVATSKRTARQVGDDASAASCSAIGYEARHHASYFLKIWQESWSQQLLDNKLHSVKPVIGAWPVMPMRRTDVKLTRLRIGHTPSHTGICCLENALLNVLHAMSLTLFITF
ncbi:hypothetical protein TNCV_4737681 [Trichonephila clavipes]|nr:hypothetical protein TNCV_4737681 [Trichonephila clavipes]